MIVRTKTVESEGIPATPIIEAEKIPTTPITGDGGGGGDTLPPNILEGSTIVTGSVSGTGIIDDTQTDYRTTDNFIKVEPGYDYLITVSSENTGQQNLYYAEYDMPYIRGFRQRYYVDGGGDVDCLTKLITPQRDYIRFSVKINGKTTISVIKVDISTITNYIELN